MKTINMITNYELETLERIDRDCKNLHVIIPPKAFLTATVSMPDGEKTLEFKTLSKTWNRNAYTSLFHLMGGIHCRSLGTSYGAGYATGKDTGNTVRSTVIDVHLADSNASSYAAAAGDTTLGIVVGTGTGAESFEDYALGTKIAHGTGAGQLSYLIQTTTPSYTAGTKTYTSVIARSFDNGSGGTITVTEVGLYRVLNSPNVWKFMIARDLLGASVDVANGQRLTVSYTITQVFPA